MGSHDQRKSKSPIFRSFTVELVSQLRCVDLRPLAGSHRERHSRVTIRDVLGPGPLTHRDEVDSVVKIHPYREAAVVAGPEARQDHDAMATTPGDPDQSRRLRI